jgi:integrase
MRKPTLYKSSAGIWQARFWNPDEKRYSISRSLGVVAEGKKQRRREAEERAAILAMEIQKSFAIRITYNKADAKKLLVDYVSEFWAKDGPYAREKALVEKKPLSAHYLVINAMCIKNRITPFPGFANLPLGSLVKPLIRQWILWMADAGLSGRAINIALQTLRIPVRRAFEDDVITSDPFSGIRRAAHTEKKRGILRPDEIRRLIDTPYTDPRSRLAVYLALYCSMRMGEVRGLCWGDIQDGIIHICHNWQDGEGIKPPKCGSEGYVPLPRLVADVLKEVWDICPLTGPNNFVLSNRPGKPVNGEFLSAALRRELAAIGITEEDRVARNIVFHSLRHSFVTACRMAGLSALETMALSRHKDEKMLARYTHAADAINLDDIRRRIEIGFSGAAPS